MPVILGGNTGIYLASLTPPAPAVDPDAQAFITAASITDPTQQAAINTLVVELKGYGVWTKMTALYPFVGSTASQQKFNLKDPRDLDAAFRLQFLGGWTHSVNGALPNGANGYANTFLSPNAQQSLTSGHFSLYSRTLGASSTLYGGNGVRDQITALGSQLILRRGADNLRYVSMWNEGTGGLANGGTETDARGFYLGSRTANNSLKFYKNNTTTGSNTATQTATSLNIYSYFLGAINQFNVALSDSYDNKQLAFSSIGDGLSDTEAANLYTAVQNFQVTLGRSIGAQTVSDADAQAFVTNAGIVDQVEANAVNNLVIGMKADGIWTKMKAIYPMVGGTATTNKFNLKNPLDIDAAFRLVFSGGWTHSSIGITPNGTNAYADSKLNQSSNLSITNNHISVYSTGDIAGNYVDCGITNNVTFSTSYINCRRTNTNGVFENGTRIAQASVANSIGHYLGTASSTNTKLFKNGTELNTSTATQTGSLFNETIVFSAVKIVGGSISGYSLRRLNFASIGDGLTDTEAANFYNRVQTFNTALARQV